MSDIEEDLIDDEKQEWSWVHLMTSGNQFYCEINVAKGYWKRDMNGLFSRSFLVRRLTRIGEQITNRGSVFTSTPWAPTLEKMHETVSVVNGANIVMISFPTKRQVDTIKELWVRAEADQVRRASGLALPNAMDVAKTELGKMNKIIRGS